jgi:hypothetical protein
VKGKQRREGSGPRPSVWRRSLDLTVAGGHRRPWPSSNPPPPLREACVRRGGGEEMGLGLQGATTATGFVHAKSAADRRIHDPRDGRLRATER